MTVSTIFYRRMRVKAKLRAALVAVALLIVAIAPPPASAQQPGFTFNQWATVAPTSGWSFVAGGFSGDCKTDVVGYHPGNGTLWVGTNTGSGFSFSRWATLAPISGWSFVAGEFSGDGQADVVGYHPINGTLWMGTNTGSGFGFSRWATLTPAAGWSFVAGDFTGDGKTDVAGYHPINGTLWMGTNTGSGFGFSRWATLTPAAGWSFVAGDFTGDSKADVVGYHPGNGTLWVGTNTGSGFGFSRWATVAPISGWSFVAGGFTGDGKADVVGYHPGNGTLWVGTNTGSGFGFSRWATLSSAAGWSFVPGEFSGDRQADVAGYRPSNGTLWAGISTGAGLPPVSSVSEFQPAVPHGGRAVAVAVRPNDANQILVGSETGGLFRTSDRGGSWTHIPALPNHRIWDVEFSPGNPNLVIVAAASNFQTPNDGGIWRSADGGFTWTRPMDAVPPPGTRCTERSSAYDVSFERGTSRIFVGTDCGLAISLDNGATWSHRPLDPSAPVNSTRTQNAVFSVLATPDFLLMAAADGLWRSVTSGFTPPFRITNGPRSGQGGINHAFAVSPLNPDHIFHAGGGQKLFLSTDAGLNWTQVPAPSIFNRGVFVRVTRSNSGNPNQIDVYFGDGQNLQRQTFTQTGTRLTGSGSWTQLNVDHADPADIGFDRSGVPVLLATDGGVHATADGGNTWRMRGGGRCGFNALQINEVTGQAITGAQPHQDLYYATHDNNIVASADGGVAWPFDDCCEGFYVRVIPVAADHSNTQVTGVDCAPCSNFTASAHLSNVGRFPNPPDGDLRANDVEGNPFPISAGTYVQNTVNNDVMPLVNTFRVTTSNSGGTWQAAFTIAPGLSGPPIIAGPTTDPTLYQPVVRPGATSDGISRIGLVRVTNFLTGAGIVSNADGTGFGSIGIFPGMFQTYRIFAANPLRPLHLIYADVETSEMKYSVDGGQNWYVDRALTDAVTANGEFAFRVGEVTHVRAISFDPFNPCLILVGTDQNGVIQSTDGGNTWSQLSGSELLTWITSFYFPPTGPVIASTYGRGLWQLRGRTAQVSCQPPRPPRMARSSGRILSVDTGASVPFRRFGDPPLCTNCSYIIVRNGVITDLEMKANRLTAVAVSGGSVHQLDSSGREVPLSIPNKYVPGRSSFDQLSKVRSLLTARGTMIRGIVVEGDVLRNIIVSETELPFDPPRIPYVRLTSANMRGGVALVEPGGTVSVHGEGFSSGTGNQGRVRILLGEEVVSQEVVVDSKGNFRTEFVVRRMPGEHEVIVEQQEGRRLTREKAKLKVITQDRPR